MSTFNPDLLGMVNKKAFKILLGKGIKLSRQNKISLSKSKLDDLVKHFE